MISRYRMLAFVGLTLILSLVACRSLSLKAKSTPPTSTPVNQAAATPRGTKASHPAEPTPSNLHLPPGVPLYPGAFSFFHAGAMVSFASDDLPLTVMNYYMEHLLANGWTFINYEPADSNAISLNWGRGNQNLNVMILEGDDFGSYISLTWP